MRDIVIIGGGPGGYVAAIRAAQLGADVVLVEKDRLGGTCLNKGCIPTKTFYRNAQLVHEIKGADSFGIGISGFSVDVSKMQERKRQVIERLTVGIGQLLKANGVEVVMGTGSLADRETVEITDRLGNKSTIKTRNILIAAGSVPSKLPIPGADLPGVLTSDEMLELETLPKNLAIIGGGVIGIEFAGICHALGSNVTVIEYLPQILASLDSEIGKRLALSMKKKGIRLEANTRVKEIKSEDGSLVVMAEGKSGEMRILADTVLVSTGRSVNTAGLNLDALGIEYGKTGIKVDSAYQTNIPGIYAIGDIIGGQMLAHVASDEGKAAVENIMGLKGQLSYDSVPSCVFTFPEIATVGLTEEDAGNRGIAFETSKFLFGANGKALTMGEEEGFVKVLAEKNSGRLIGVHIMGPHASDLIHEGAIAIENKLDSSHIGKTVFAHPTLSEAFAEAVLGIENRAVHMAPKKAGK